jgi:RNA recognition motif-containing protein
MSSDAAEAELMRMAARRPSLRQLFSPSLEADVATSYMLHRRKHYSDTAWIQLVWGMHTSRTVYVGNLSFTTREEQIHELFSRAGRIHRIIMGLNAQTRTPCGFAFVEFDNHDSADLAQRCLAGMQLEGRVLRADLDQEFESGREFGRSKSGGQLQDDARRDFDLGRGGWGVFQQQQRERIEAAARHRQDQTDTFNVNTEEEEEFFDPTETIQRTRSDNTTYKLSAATIAALTEDVFPHYALPMDDRVRRALHLAQQAENASGTNNAAAASAHNGAAAASVAQPAKRPLSPERHIPASVASAASSGHSPLTKRPRQLSPTSRTTHSPVPFASTSPVRGATAGLGNVSPQPMMSDGSPRPQYRNRSSSPSLIQQHSEWSDNEQEEEGVGRGMDHRYTPDNQHQQHHPLSDGERTPPPIEEELAQDDATPPPTPPPPSHIIDDEHELDDDAFTPQRMEETEETEDTKKELTQMGDDTATPPPDNKYTEHRRMHNNNEQCYDEFER